MPRPSLRRLRARAVAAMPETGMRDAVFDRLPDDTVVHPGHGTGTTLGAERPQLRQWLERGW